MLANAMELFSVAAKLFLDKSEYDKDIKDADSSGKSLAENLSGYMEKAKKFLVALGIGAAIKQAAGAIWNLAKETSAAGDRIDKNSQALGMSRKAYQEWDYILAQSGASIDNMGMSMKTMSEAIRANSGETAAGLSRLGLSAAQLQRLSPEDQFETLVRAFQKMPAGAEKSRLAMQLFGRNAQSLMPLLNSSSTSIDELRANAEKLGLIMSDEDVDASVAFGDALDDLSRTWTSFKMKIGARLLPGFTQAFKNLSGVIGNLSNALVGSLKTGDWSIFFGTLSTEIGNAIPNLVDKAIKVVEGIFKNADKLVKIAVSIINGLVTGITNAIPILVAELPSIVNTIWDGLKSSIELLGNEIIDLLNKTFGTNIPKLDFSSVTDAWQWIMDNKDTIITAVEAIIAAFVVAKIADFVAGLSPLKLAFIAVAAAITLVATHWDEIKDWIGKKWETVVEWAQNSWELIKQSFDIFVSYVSRPWEVAVTWVRKSWAYIVSSFHSLETWVGKTWQATVTWIRKSWSIIVASFHSLEDWVAKSWQATVTWVRKSWASIVASFHDLEKWVSKSWQATVTWVRNAWTNIRSAFSQLGSWVNKKWEATVKWANNAWNDVKDAFTTAKDWVTEKAHEVKIAWQSTADDYVKKIKDWVTNKTVGEIAADFVSTVDDWIKKIKDWMDGIGLTDVIIDLKGQADEWIKRIKNWFAGTEVGKVTISFVHKVTNWIKKIQEWLAKSDIGQATISFVQSITDWIQRIWDWLQGKSLSDIVLSFTQSLTAWITRINDWINGKIGSIKLSFWAEVSEWIKRIWDWIQNGVNVAVNFIGGLFGGGDSQSGQRSSNLTGFGSGRSYGGGYHSPATGTEYFLNAKGLNYVPYDNYPALLHRGETVLNQDDGRRWRQGGSGGFNSRDLYGAIASAVASAVSEIQINLDGKSVGNAVTNQVSRNMYNKQIGRRFGVA